jgi:hypothetical protein
MASYQITIWDNEDIDNDPPTVKTRPLHCAGVVKKVELSFKFDVSGYQGCILDELKPIVINNQEVPIQLPSDKIKLKLVDMSGIDVTQFVKASKDGEQNTITVNYKVKNKPWFFEKFGRRKVGKLRLMLTLHWQESGRKCANGHEIPAGEISCPQCNPKGKFCMWHGEQVQALATTCPFQSGSPVYETVVTPTTRKTCPNPSCKRTIHIKEIYCEYCGLQQPAIAHT